MSVTIRRSNPGDVEQIEQLYQEYMRIDASRKEIIRCAMDGEDSLIRVAEAESKVVGLIHQVFYADPLHAGKCSNLLFLYVSERFRRQGVGRLLLEAALKDAAEKGIIEVHVSTRASNRTAIRLYEGSGFEYAGPLFEHNPPKEAPSPSSRMS